MLPTALGFGNESLHCSWLQKRFCGKTASKQTTFDWMSRCLLTSSMYHQSHPICFASQNCIYHFWSPRNITSRPSAMAKTKAFFPALKRSSPMRCAQIRAVHEHLHLHHGGLKFVTADRILAIWHIVQCRHTNTSDSMYVVWYCLFLKLIWFPYKT